MAITLRRKAAKEPGLVLVVPTDPASVESDTQKTVARVAAECIRQAGWLGLQ